MNGLPRILRERRDGTRTELDIVVDPGNPWFAGHFPQLAILPGVVQIGWAEHFARTLHGFDTDLRGLEQVKFKRPILPGTELTLRLTADAAAKKLKYEYRDAEFSYSSGTLNFGAPA
jgi:3-hydroxymyristoyl/3-hydroxydecanoyl-(acyl carrier protein) dehydratase